MIIERLLMANLTIGTALKVAIVWVIVIGVYWEDWFCLSTSIGILLTALTVWGVRGTLAELKGK